ncbi:thiamine pyrophosphate-binding protein [Pollutimonas bauzanensis]|uniref:Thiamine pyrophosphate-binding protein n=1 Tax=Pollutimonas bauzanensis TaxID=658167 RepID=A0A1M6A8E3_9BURK|nr:thiamine pyrophosphate-binding protein [Pollutimonas bauzanensis]SHI32403.1 hypothetical protein SAMN04488135_12141 [Pollutimonas bauzanensis]
MNKTIAARRTGFPAQWRRWRYHLSALLLILPLAYLPRYFDDLALSRGDKGLGQREIGQQAVGPWSLRLAEWRIEAPQRQGEAGYMKVFTLALCKECVGQVKAAYLRVGKPRSLRAAGALFSGSPYRQMTSVPIPVRAAPDADLWLTLEGWDGSVHQASWPLKQASPTTAAWLRKQGETQ